MGIDSNGKKSLSISIGKSSIPVEVTTFVFFIDFDQLMSKIDINHRLISITID